MSWRSWLICAALLGAPSAWAKDDDLISGAASVVDANTLIVHNQKLRLFGMDAPDRGQTCATKSGGSYPCGQRAFATLNALARNQLVQCEPKGVDAQRRILATCSLAGLDLAGAMIEAGWALANTAFAPEYGPTELAAKASGVGLWAGPFVAPSTWRASHGG